MKNILYSVKTIRLLPSYMRNPLIKGQFCEDEFPFDRLYLEIKETNKCPFCGKETVMYRCDCEKFTAQFTKMQDFVHDEKHETVIHVYPYENLCGQTNNINVSIEQLTAHEIEDLGPDFWDEARKVIDNEKNRSYFVVQLSYKEERLDFIYKDLQSKSVYRCSMEGYGYKKHKFYIGSLHRKIISHGDKTLGNYHFEDAWKDLAEFSDWNELCEKLKSIWNFEKGPHIERLFLFKSQSIDWL